MLPTHWSKRLRLDLPTASIPLAKPTQLINHPPIAAISLPLPPSIVYLRIVRYPAAQAAR